MSEVVERYTLGTVPYGPNTLVADPPLEVHLLKGRGNYYAHALGVLSGTPASTIARAKTHLLRDLARGYAYWIDTAQIDPALHEGYVSEVHADELSGVAWHQAPYRALRLDYASPEDEAVAARVHAAVRQIVQAQEHLRTLAAQPSAHPLLDAAWDALTNMGQRTGYQIGHPTRRPPA